MVVYAGQGDPRRSMALLWRGQEPTERTGPGPKAQLSVDLVVETAIEVADTEGMQALSMRAVGERLGRTAMSLYTYVASKNELIDLMYDHAFGELVREWEENLPEAPTLQDTDDRTDWREAVLDWAGNLWRFYLRHPWSLEISQTRPVLGPNGYRLFEALAAVLHRAGLGPKAISSAYGSLFNLVRGMVRTAAEARQAQTVTGISEDEWWYARSAQLEEVAVDFSERFPTLTLMSQGGAFDNADPEEPYLEQEAWETFRFGLNALLDGIQSQIDESSSAAP
ncbi:TetR/AcrR family transcriptional regulator [Nocardiopsis terrae]